MDNFLIIVVIIAILVAALTYIIKAKKRGEKCIGCPLAKTCGRGQSGCNCNKD